MCLRRFFGPSHSISAHILEDHVRWFISIEFGVVESGHNRTGRGKNSFWAQVSSFSRTRHSL